VAKRTPDYTKQVSHQRTRAERPGKQRGERPGGKQRAVVPDPPVSYSVLTFVSLFGGAELYIWAAFMALGGSSTKTVAVSVAVALCGVLTNVLTGVLALYALYPQRFPMRRVNKRMLAAIIVVVGGIAIMSLYNSSLLSPGLIPPVAVFFFVIRPRLKQIAEADGRYTPSKRDQALEEIRQRREARRREKEAEARQQQMIKGRLAKAPADEVAARRAARQSVEKPPATAGGAAGGRPAAPGKDKPGPSAEAGPGPRKGGGTR
jgi:hypothetical protein